MVQLPRLLQHLILYLRVVSCIVYLEYSEYGTMAQPNDYFKIELLDNGKVKVNRQRGIDEEEFVADRSLIVELKKIYEAGRVNSWKDSYEPKYEVLDGYSWNLDVRFDNGLEKYSHGNNARPDSDALRQFSTLIWNLKYIIKDGLVTIVISP